MTEEPPPNPPRPDAPKGEEADFASEGELDEVLSQASELAAELSEQVGVVDTPRASMDATPATGDGQSPPADVATESDGPASADAKYDVPRFMEEFTEPKQSSEPAQRRSEPTAAGSPTPRGGGAVPNSAESAKPGVVGTGMIGVVGAVPAASEKSDKVPPDDPFAKPAEPLPAAPDAPRREGGSGQTAALPARFAWTLCDRALSLFELIDRPVAGLGKSARRIIGWLAIATVGTSIIVYLCSL